MEAPKVITSSLPYSDYFSNNID